MSPYLKKYPDVNAGVANASMLYHKDIDLTVSVTMLKEALKWKDVGKSIKQAITGYKKDKQTPLKSE